MSTVKKILEISNLSIDFFHEGRTIRAVDDVGLDIYENEVLALVGQSGSGKTVTALSVTGILPDNSCVREGRIMFRGVDLLKAGEKKLEEIRGKEISYIFQEACASLNPVLTIGRQIQESVALHQGKEKSAARRIVLDLLKSVRFDNPEDIMMSYPHQLSGGMNQRAMLAMALSSKKTRLLIADEPTTALDVTIEAQIISMLIELKERLGLSILFITHNLALVEKFADRVAIMFEGRIVESGPVKDIFLDPKHEHTRQLIDAVIKI